MRNACETHAHAFFPLRFGEDSEDLLRLEDLLRRLLRRRLLRLPFDVLRRLATEPPTPFRASPPPPGPLLDILLLLLLRKQM